MLPAAPVRFSITTGWPHLRDSQSATSRGMASAVPPAGNGTMIFTARDGKSWARGGEVRLASAASAKKTAPAKRIVARTTCRHPLIKAFSLPGGTVAGPAECFQAATPARKNPAAGTEPAVHSRQLEANCAPAVRGEARCAQVDF